jgi:PAS domain S-box-containing protein
MIAILYVDDEPDLLEIGKLFLERSGEFGVDIITSAPDALILMEAKAYDAIISDYQMPGMDGIEFLKEVRNSGNTIPFILFTGRGREEIVIQALNEGADFYLQKGGEPLSQFAELAHQVRLAVQQRRAEASVRAHERREADILNFLPDATFAIDTAGKILAWNQAMEELTGVKFSEIAGKDKYEYALRLYNERRPILIDLILVPDEEIEKGRYLYTIRENKMLTAESEFEKPDGTQVHLWGKASLLFDQNGNIAGAIESVRDITEHRRSETELRAAYEQITASEKEMRSQYNKLAESEKKIRENEENFQKLVESSPDAIYIAVHEKFVYVNPAMIRLMGATSANQLLGTSIFDRIHPSFHEGIWERSRIVIDEGKPVGHKETVYLKLDGSPIDIESAVSTFRYHDNPAGLVILRNISRRKQTERLLQESEEKYRELVENANNIILKLDKAGNVTFLNEYAQRFFGFTSEEIIGKPVMGTIVPATQSGSGHDLSLMIDDIIRHPENHIINENENITCDGRRVWIRWQNKPLFDENGQFAGLFSVGTDITERKHAEEALRESEEHFRSIFENAPIGIFHSLPEGKIIDINPAYARMLGYDSVEEITEAVNRHGVAETIYVTPERRPQLVREVTESGNWQTYENLYRRKDGSTLYGLLSFRSYINSASGRRELEGFVVDISGNRVAEEALRQSEIRFREQYQNNPLAIFTWQHRDGDFVLIGCNKAAEVLTGGRADEYFGMRASDLYKSRPELVSAVRQCFSEQTGISKEILSEHFLPGKFIHSTASFVPPDLILVHMEDITERRQVEKALADNRRMLETLMHNLPGMVYRCRNDPDWTMEFVSGGCRDLTGYDPGDLIDNRILSYGALIVPEDRQHVYEVVQKGIEDRQPFQIEYRITDKTGVTRWVWEQGRGIFDSRYELVALEGYIADNSEHKRAAETLRQANRNFNLLYGITRHDINNQLMALNGFIGLLHEKTPDPALDYYFNWIAQSMSRISAMIRFTKEYETIGITAPLWQDARNIVNTAAQQAPLGKVTVKNEIPVGSELFADPLIIRVFYNLMENAVRYGGRITTIRFFLEVRDGENIIVCEDDGLGIPRADKEKIFERNFGKNTGLGLFLAREILSITGITITETGMPENGARFEMALPHGAFRHSDV